MAKDVELPQKWFCQTCGKVYDINNFYAHKNPYYKIPLMHYCKDCCKTISNEIMSKNANFELCTRNMCIFFDLPFTYEAMERFKLRVKSGTADRNISYLFNYLRALDDLDVPIEYWGDLSGASYFGIDLLKVAKPTSDGDIEILLQLEKEWGKQEKIEDYLFLEETFNSYANGETLTAAMSNTLHYLCLAIFDVKKLREQTDADQKEISAAEKRVTDYYNKLKLDDFKFNKSKSAGELLIEEWAHIYESKEPLEWVDENLEDICGFRADSDEIYRALANKVVGSKDYPKLTVDDIKNTPKVKKKNDRKTSS